MKKEEKILFSNWNAKENQQKEKESIHNPTLISGNCKGRRGRHVSKMQYPMDGTPYQIVNRIGC